MVMMNTLSNEFFVGLISLISLPLILWAASKFETHQKAKEGEVILTEEDYEIIG